MSTHVRNLAWWIKGSFKSNSIVLITGAASGIGMNIAYIYASRKCRLLLIDLNGPGLANVEARCKALGSQAASFVCDVTNVESCKSMNAEAIKLYGGVDILVLCAGIGAHHLFHQTKNLNIFHKLMDVNFFGYLNCVHACYSSLCESNGLLIAITSFSGEVGLPYRTAYCASKFAVTGLLESLRAEMEHVHNNNNENNKSSKGNKFHITIVCPPSVDTNLRKNALTDDPNLKDSPPKHSMTVEECALAIVDAGDRRLRKAFFPATSFLANYLRPLVPDVMDKLIMKRAKL